MRTLESSEFARTSSRKSYKRLDHIRKQSRADDVFGDYQRQRSSQKSSQKLLNRMETDEIKWGIQENRSNRTQISLRE